MAKRRRTPSDVEPEESNMTPMIDVVFQLLIFFMLTMQFKEIDRLLAERSLSWRTRADFLYQNFRPYLLGNLNPSDAAFIDGSVLNIGKRTNLRRMMDIGLPYDTPLEKVE